MLPIQKKLTRSFFVLLSMPATAMGTALSVQIAALSWILNTKYGFDLHEIGMVWMAGPLAGILGQVIIGFISDKVWFWGGRRRPFILIGGVIASLMLLSLPYIDVINDTLGLDSLIGVAIAVALSLDLAINISFNPTRSIIADVTTAGDTRTNGYTWMQTISGFFGVLAYLVGAFISNYVLLYTGAIVVFLFSFIPPFFIEEPTHLEEDSAENTPEISAQKTNWIEFLKICLAHAFTWIGVQTMFVYSFSYIKEVIMGFETTAKLSEVQNNEIGMITGIAFAILNTVGFLLPAFILTPLSEKIGRVRTHMVCIAVMSLGYLGVVMLGNSATMLYIFMAIIGVGWAAVVSLPFAIMSETVDQSRMGFFMGLFNLSVVLPQLISSQLGDFLDNQEDKVIIYIISAICLGISAVLWLLVKESKNTDSKPAVSGGGH